MSASPTLDAAEIFHRVCIYSGYMLNLLDNYASITLCCVGVGNHNLDLRNFELVDRHLYCLL